MEAVTLDLRAYLAELAAEGRKKRVDKRWLSHALAKFFMDSLEYAGVRILESGTGNANYFCAEIGGAPVAISPFGSHEEFWDKVSDGFRSLVMRRACRWGVVLFVLPERKGLWIEGSNYDAQVLQKQEKVHSPEVRRAEKLGIAHAFYETKGFMDLITHGPKIRSKTVLFKRRGHD